MIHRRITLGSALALVVMLAAPGAVRAEPGPATIDDRRAIAAELRAQLDEQGELAGALAEALNRAQHHLEELEAEIVALATRIDAAAAEVAERRELLGRRAASAYKRAGSGGALEIMDVSDPAERNQRAKYSNAVARSEAVLLDELRAAQDELERHRRSRGVAVDAAADERDELAKAAAALQATTDEQAALLAGVDADIRELVEEERRREAEEWARLAPPPPPPPAPEPETASPPPTTDGAPAPAAPAPPPASGGAQAAVSYAHAQVGKPYCAYPGPRLGPDCFDCSGLTHRAWEAAGVIIPTNSGAQFAAGYPKVPIPALQPGDLVFWGAGGSSHVGLYIGNGMMIDAPQTGGHVQITTIHRPSGGPMGAVRPG